MTLQELLAKNEATRKRREAERAASARKKKTAVAVESEKGTDVVEDAPKKRGRKPANREYMVVENIESVNDDTIEQVKV